MKKERARSVIGLRLEQFKRVCDEKNIRHREVDEQGLPAKAILRYSMFYDLLVVGLRTYFHFETQDKPGDSLEKLLDHAITPILAAPAEFVPIRNVLIAFDGSFPAARALQRFAHLARTEQFRFKILMSSSDGELADYLLGQARTYLTAYGITDAETIWTPENLKKEMREKYFDWADLIVLGAHSKKGIMDFVAGSFAKYVIQEDKKPIFITQ